MAGKRLVRDYYGDNAEYSYFEGCSQGGRQAFMSAQRYPQDFDGIIAGAPAFNYQGLNAAGTWNLQRIFRDNLGVIWQQIAPVMAVLTVWHCSTNFTTECC